MLAGLIIRSVAVKRISIILIALLLILAGCADERVVHGLEGSYVGTFVRIHPGSFSTSSDVVLLLNDGTFQGNAIQSRFPAICSGTYTTSGNRITFVNTCIWTAVSTGHLYSTARSLSFLRRTD